MLFRELELINKFKKIRENPEKSICVMCHKPLKESENSIYCENENCKAFMRKKTLKEITELYEELDSMVSKINIKPLKEEHEEKLSLLENYLKMKVFNYLTDFGQKDCPICGNELISDQSIKCDNCRYEFEKDLIDKISNTQNEIQHLMENIKTQIRTIGKEYPQSQRKKFM